MSSFGELPADMADTSIGLVIITIGIAIEDEIIDSIKFVLFYFFYFIYWIA